MRRIKKLRLVHRPVELITPPLYIRLVMGLASRLAWNWILASQVPQQGLPFRICGRYDVQEALDYTLSSCERSFCRGQLVTQLSDLVFPSLTIRRCRSRNIVDGTNPQRTSLFLRDNLKNQKKIIVSKNLKLN